MFKAQQRVDPLAENARVSYEQRLRQTPTRNRQLPALARLSADSGGRFTDGANALGLALDRAAADRSCVYSVGFYDRALPRDRVLDVTIRVGRRGAQVLHPSRFIIRSDAAKREDVLRAAFSAAGGGETTPTRAQWIRLLPDGNRWEGLVAVSFPVPSQQMNL